MNRDYNAAGKAKLQIALAMIIALLAAASLASAAIPIDTERALQDGSPEKLLIAIQSVKKRNRVLVYNYEVIAEVIAVEKSGTGLKKGDALTIRYWLHNPAMPVPPGAYPIEVKKGKNYKAYLGPPRGAYRDMDDKKKKIYFPTAASGSFSEVAANVPAAEKGDKDQAPKEQTEAQKKKKAKNAGKRAGKDYMKQLEAGDPTAAQLPEYLTVDASRIGATIDHPSSLGIAVIRKLKQMPPEKRTKEVLPALEKRLMQMLREDVEPAEMVSLMSDSPANPIMISGRFLNMVNALAAIGPEAHPVLAKALGHNPALDLFITRKLGTEARTATNGLLENPTDAE